MKKLPPREPPPPPAETIEQMLRRMKNEAAVALCATGFEGIDQAARNLKKAIIRGLSGK